MNQHIESALNEQISKEASSSQYYLSMASWAESKGLSGTAFFMYAHSDEERFHMLKLVKFVNERGGRAVVPSIPKPPSDFDTVQRMFELLLEHQWYVSEQMEEEALARSILDKLNLIGNETGGMYLFDREMLEIANSSAPQDKK